MVFRCYGSHGDQQQGGRSMFHIYAISISDKTGRSAGSINVYDQFDILVEVKKYPLAANLPDPGEVPGRPNLRFGVPVSEYDSQ